MHSRREGLDSKPRSFGIKIFITRTDVAAVRALRQRGVRPAGARLRDLYDRGLARLPAGDEDRPLDIDIAAAEQVITALAEG